MTQVAQVQIGGIHAFSVVCNMDFFLAPLLDGNLDAGGSGVNCVLDQLLYSGCRALNYLSRSDFIDDFIG